MNGVHKASVYVQCRVCTSSECLQLEHNAHMYILYFVTPTVNRSSQVCHAKFYMHVNAVIRSVFVILPYSQQFSRGIYIHFFCSWGETAKI